MNEPLTQLQNLSRKSIVRFEITPDKQHIDIIEQCDAYFSTLLTKTQFGELIQELTNLHNSML